MNTRLHKQLLTLTLGLLLVPIFAFAENTTQTEISEASSTTPVTTTSTFTSCSQEAIEERDTKLGQARNIYNTAMNAALLERKNTEKAAIALDTEKEKKEAIKDSVETYKTKTKQAQTNLTQARKNIWLSFENTVKDCREDYNKGTTSNDKELAKEEKNHQKTLDQEAKTFKATLFDSIKSLFGTKE
ncbi:MAG: hypothetical protein RLZZ308_78 [Candidatus Parcubacteria bacterium]|jgi:hypothetical protein